ncbi:MAG: hypothetical protein RR543_03555 [Erysipelotrichales bacterium]
MKKTKLDKIFTIGLFAVGIGIIIYHFATYFSTGRHYSMVLGLQMILGLVVIIVPQLVYKIFKIEMAPLLRYLYWTFIFFAVFIGTGLEMYGKIFLWDKLLHLTSAMLLCSVGYALIGYFISEEVVNKINPIIITIFAFMFAVAVGAFWEMYEFTGDGFFNLNMQRYMKAGVPFIGRVALYDTMSDMFVNTLGALIYAIVIHLKLRKEPEVLLEIAFKKDKK